ncbi:MAG: hypothetical protein WKG00_16205 [Polyangiaceae bacterium]
MSTRRPNLMDPDFEPTGEELQALAHRAFEGVVAEHERALAELHVRILEARAQLREQRLGASHPPGK